MRFLGNSEAKTDAKGRVFLPAVFRKQLQAASQECLILRKDTYQDCLVLYPENVWNEQMNELRCKLNRWNSRHQMIFRQFVSDVEVIKEELTQTFDRCLTPCREVRGNKLYFCVMARSVSDNLHFNEGQDDYLDLELLKSDNYKKVLLEFNLGYSEKGYLDMCHRCHGIDAVNYPIPIAEQLYGEDK